MTSFTYRMPAGIPGAVTRVEHATIEPGLYSSGAPFSAFGLPAKISGALTFRSRAAKRHPHWQASTFVLSRPRSAPTPILWARQRLRSPAVSATS